MDIFNRPPAISEDTLQYTLYLPNDLSERASVTTLATLMRAHVDSLLQNHLWHRDAFELKVVKDQDGDGWILEGTMRVGDCVDDEWCTVWLLREISAKWDVVISVFDSDGEFLLIEAAEVLPKWVSPSNAENRVWIYNSHLHLIPLTHVSAPSSKPRRPRYPTAKDSDDEGDITQNHDEDDYITVHDALKAVRDPLVDTVAPAEIERTIWKRISGYPAATRQHIHVTKGWLPADVARALAVDPSLVQKPVETFYTRDAVQLRAAHRMSRFPPEPSVLTTLKMTRTAYAQLVGQKFHPPKIFGRWKEKEGTNEWRWRDVGMKIACGFEMLYQESKSRSDATATSAEVLKSSAQARKDALRRNPDYVKYIENLKSSGYFRGELEGSQLWSELEDKAVAAFLEARREDDASRPSFASAVNTAVSQTGYNFVPPQQDEDPEDWLNVNEGDFDSMLEKTFGTKHDANKIESSDAMDVDSPQPATEIPEDRVAKQQATRLKDLAQKVEEFVEGEGDIEGARFADEEFSDEEFDDDKSESESGEEEEEEEENPQRSQQDDAERTARQAAMDRLVPGLDPSEYGRMPPSFHSNSQRVTATTIETEMREEIPSSAAEPRKRPIRPPIIPRDTYDGVDSDDETDEEGADDADEEEEENRPQVVGEVEIDMEEEEDEFLEFARQALGMSDDQWQDIVRERKDRGAYVPTHVVAENKHNAAATKSGQASDAFPESAARRRTPEHGPRPNVNPNLDSFEAVMQAMDAELSRSRAGDQSSMASGDRKGKAKATASDDDNAGLDIEAAMDAELKAALEQEKEEDDDGQVSGDVDYKLIKNFLESFKSQGGLSGPVGNLAGRLQQGWTLPRDHS